MKSRIQTNPEGTVNPTLPLPLPVESDEFLTTEELAARLKVNERTIERWQAGGQLPFVRVTGTVRYHWPTVVKHLTENFKVAARGVVKPMTEAGGR